jgi:hypothetical protein
MIGADVRPNWKERPAGAREPEGSDASSAACQAVRNHPPLTDMLSVMTRKLRPKEGHQAPGLPVSSQGPPGDLLRKPRTSLEWWASSSKATASDQRSGTMAIPRAFSCVLVQGDAHARPRLVVLAAKFLDLGSELAQDSLAAHN